MSDTSITIQGRKLSYRFYSHFHPYVADLVKRLTKRFEVRKDGNQLMVRDIA